MKFWTNIYLDNLALSNDLVLPCSWSPDFDLIYAGLKKRKFFLKKSPTQWVFWVLFGFWVLLGFLDKQEKIGKIIQKLSNSKP